MGFKISYKQEPFYGEQIQNLKELMQHKDFDFDEGTIEKIDILKPYTEMIKSKIK